VWIAGCGCWHGVTLVLILGRDYFLASSIRAISSSTCVIACDLDVVVRNETKETHEIHIQGVIRRCMVGTAARLWSCEKRVVDIRV